MPIILEHLFDIFQCVFFQFKFVSTVSLKQINSSTLSMLIIIDLLILNHSISFRSSSFTADSVLLFGIL